MIRNFGASGINQQPQGLDLGIGSSGLKIKSVQSGTLTLNGTNETYSSGIQQYYSTVTIAAVSDINKCVVIIEPLTLQNPCQTEVIGTMASTTSFNTFRYNTGANVTIRWKVIEFENAKSVQHGIFSTTGTTFTTTISAVDMTKALVFANRSYDLNNTGANDHHFAYYLSNGTTISFDTPWQSGQNNRVSWFVIESI